jgi:uncharacterized protein YgiM (DUF1202 family)
MTNTKPGSSKSALTLSAALISTVAILIAGCAPAATPAPTAAPTTASTEALAPLPTIQPSAPSANAPVATTTTDTYVRTGAGTQYPAYGIAPAGASAEVVATNGDKTWYAVAVPVDKIAAGYAWVIATNVTVTGDISGLPVYPAAPLPAGVSPNPPAAGDPQVVALESVYVRSGPGDIYPAYGIAQKGAVGTVVGKSSDGSYWVVALPTSVVGAGQGWVSAAYVQASNVQNVPVVANPPPPTPVAATPIQPGQPSCIATTAVNVRSGPSDTADIYGVAPGGTVFLVLGVSSDSGWWQVQLPTDKVPSGQGWVSAAYCIGSNTSGVPVVSQ